MTIICAAFRCSCLPDGKIRLVIQQAETADTDFRQLDPNGTRILYIKDVAKVLRKSPKTIYKLLNRTKPYLPITRGPGRPYVMESVLYAFLAGDHQLTRRDFLKTVGNLR
jgi:hypothetical protein